MPTPIRINCLAWHGDLYPGGCAAGHFGGRPSAGVCRICPHRRPIDPAAPATSGAWPPPEPPPGRQPAPTIAVPVLTGHGIAWERRPRPTLSMAKAWAIAATRGAYVPADAVAERDRICAGCDKVREDARGKWCGLCGCKVAPEAARLRNLAAYAENMPGLPGYVPEWPAWGCKHPARGKGRGWPLPVITGRSGTPEPT